jgi:hypothetical protein
VLWLSEGDAPTKFFHVQANARCHCKFIRSLDHDGQVLVTGDRKAAAVFEYFGNIMGTPPDRDCAIAFENLDLPQLHLNHLYNRFTEAKVWDVIKELPPDKALGLDGFSARFLQATWLIIQPDLMRALDAFWRYDMHNMHDVNGALMVLLLETNEATSLKQFMPISLIHIVGKLISNLLANRLAPWSSELVHPSQSAFIKRWFIQDNFKYVQSAV